MFKKISLLSLTLCFVISSPTYAQQEVAVSKENYVPKPAVAKLHLTNFDRSKVKGTDNTHFSQRDFGFMTTLGKKGEIDSGLFVYGFQYKQRDFRIKTNTNQHTTQLYNIMLPLTYVRKGNERSYVVRVTPGLSSTLDKIHKEDIAGNAVFQIIQGSDNIKYSYGVVYTHAFGKGRILPMVSSTFVKNPNWSFSLGFPVSRAVYAPSNKSSYFAKLTPNGGSWHAYSDDTNGKKDAIEYKFKQVGYRASLGGQWNLTGPLWLALETGVQFAQEITFTETGGGKEELSAENTQFTEIALKAHF